jgi:hypothetical protein
MRTLNILGLAVLAVVVWTIGTGSASATTLTSPAGTTLPLGTELKASNEGAFQVHTPIETRTCDNSKWSGKVTQQGGASETVVVELSSLAIDQCTSPFTFFVVKPGRFEIHTDTSSADGNGIVTWNNATFTTLQHTIVGTFHCLYHSSTAPAGTLTGSKNLKGGTATLTFEYELVPDKEYPWWEYCTEGFENEKGEWIEKGPLVTGSYTIETPDYLDVD